MAGNKSPAEYLESLVLWMHERPQMYCLYTGELDSVLWYLHLAWAKFAHREAEYQSALETAYQSALGTTYNSTRGLLTDEERLVRVDVNNEVTQRVLGFWSRVDQELALQVRVDGWNEPSEPV